MAPRDGSDPALLTPIPLDGDGEELIGSVIDDRYRLDAPLGRGGMGLVFRATHIGMRRQVAVKILHPSLAASPDVRNRFEREALAVGKIDHPNCVATFDVGRLPDGALYLAMELLEGHSLADALERERQIVPGRALHILAHVLRGLGAVHAAGLIHRDIKPENIFLIRNGTDEDFAKILDFGIAKPMSGELSDDGVRLTQAGMAFGTPIYMAPEQALGNPMDGRADLYAAAVIAYEMLCGQPPFYSDDKLEVMSMHTAKPVPPMRARLIKGGKPVPSSLERLIVRGLTKKPADRYRDAETFLAAVEAALETPEGGQTDVLFERPGSETGAHPLLDPDGEVYMTDGTEGIANDIHEMLATTTSTRGTPARGSGNTAPARAPERANVGAVPAERLGTTLGIGVGDGPTTVAPPIVATGDPRGRPGGVGIGIPYTGPSGEPIFGLTPEQRLAHTHKRKRWPLYAGIAGVAVVAGVIFAFVTRPHGSDRVDPATPAGQATAALSHGDPGRARDILEQHASEIAQDPRAQLVLGDAHAALHEDVKALDAYDKALTLDPSLEATGSLRDNVRVDAASLDPVVVGQAFTLWVSRTHDDAAKTALLKAAKAQNPQRREVARQVLAKLKIDDNDLLAESYGMDLDDIANLSCESRHKAVAALRALGNPIAIPVLGIALTKERAKVNRCLIGDAKSAQSYLGALKKK
jgi:serine/threonine protein kinase